MRATGTATGTSTATSTGTREDYFAALRDAATLVFAPDSEAEGSAREGEGEGAGAGAGASASASASAGAGAGAVQGKDTDCVSVTTKVMDCLYSISRAMLRARILLRSMGDSAGVPIEPSSQSPLLDATARLPGVLAAGVPGAGGYDAVYALFVDPGAGLAKGEEF